MSVFQRANKSLSKRINSFFINAVNQQLTTAGYSTTFKKISRKPYWQNRYSITTAQKETFRTWFIRNAVSTLGWSRTEASHEYLSFMRDYGFRNR
jgi:negative regulator of replication initiation